jgi:hypothetical protein
MYGEINFSPWCPWCGYSKEWEEVESVEVKEDDLQKTERVIEYEDNLTESYCKDGGWYNPITKKCMGTGNGFIPRKT